MKFKISLLCLALFASGCATTYDRVRLNDEDFVGKPLAIVNAVPFVEQEPKLCGPTALYMVTKSYLPDETLAEVSSMSFTPGASGAYPQDMLSATRRLGMAPYLVKSFPQIVDFLAKGVPVVIFHRTGFLWKDYWHYSVLTGYDRLHETFSMHIGPYAYKNADISDVLGSWNEGGKWAFVALAPSQIPSSADYPETLDNSFAFLRLGMNEAAYQLSSQMLLRWPERYEADVVMAEALLKLNESKKALTALKRAFQKEPDNASLKAKIQEFSRAH
jgi:hypothetical protein